MTTVFQNVTRLNHLLSLFRLSSDELLDIISEGLVNRVPEEKVFSDTIQLSTLKKIDKIFNKGLSYYVDPSPVLENKKESIFFRKDHFNASLNLSAKQFVDKYEEKKINFETVLKLSDIRKKRKLPIYSILDNPKKVASEIRPYLYPVSRGKTKDFLRAVIFNMAEQNILVFEYVEHPSKSEKANINGFYLSPDAIVVKWQKYTKRELFTLIHELGHYLINEEEIDDSISFEVSISGLSDIEKWCNEFAFEFLIGEYNIDNLSIANASNNYHEGIINEISEQTYLSALSLYTRLLNTGKVSQSFYNKKLEDIKQYVSEMLAREKAIFEANKKKVEEKGGTPGGGLPKPIISPLYLQSLQVAFYTGILDEYEFCSTLNIPSDKIDAYLV